MTTQLNPVTCSDFATNLFYAIGQDQHILYGQYNTSYINWQAIIGSLFQMHSSWIFFQESQEIGQAALFLMMFLMDLIAFCMEKC